MSDEPNNAFLAGRLIQWGLDPRCRPAQEPEYRKLIDRYLDRDIFRQEVLDVCRGLGISILDAGPHGLILTPEEGSPFAFRPADFRPTSAADDRLLDGLIQLGLASFGEGNIDENPQFVDMLGMDYRTGTEDDDLRLSSTSPCVDAGDPNYVPEPDETDLDGNRRIISYFEKRNNPLALAIGAFDD